MNFKKPIIAALIALVLMGIYALDRQMQQSETLGDIRKSRLIPIDVVDATRVELKNSNGNFVIEKRDEENWQIIEPINFPADNGQVKALIDNLHGAKLMETFKSSDLLAYGLENPVAELTVVGMLEGQEVTKRIQIGGDSGELSRVYVKYADVKNEIHTVGDWVRNQALKDARTLREKSLLDFDRDFVTTINITGGKESLSIEKSERSATGWLMNGEVPVNKERLDRMLVTMESLQAVDLFDDPTTSVADLGLEPGFKNLEFVTEERTQTLSIGKKLPEAFYATSSLLDNRSEDFVAGIVRDRFLREVFYIKSDWQTQRVLWRPVDDYVAIRSESLNNTTRVYKEDNEWFFEGFEGVPVRIEKLAELFAHARDIAGFEYEGADFPPTVERTDFGIRDESYRLVAELPDGSEEGLVLGLLAESSDYAYIKRIQDNSIWKVNPINLKGVRFSRKELQDKRIFSGFVADIARCKISTSNDTVYNIEFEQNSWKFKESGRPTSIVPTPDVQQFFRSVENVEWTAGLAALNSDETDVLFDFYNSDDELIYFFHIYRSDFSQVLANTPEGPFLIEESQMTPMLTALQRLLQLANQI